MKTRKIELPLDTARRWYEQGGELKEVALGAYTEQELVGDVLSKTWSEYCKLKGVSRVKIDAALDFAYVSINGAFTDYHDTQKHIAYMKLHLLRDEYRNGWKPNWGDDNDKWSVERYFNFDTNRLEIKVAWGLCAPYFLSFQTKELATEFLTNFRELIEQAGDLI